MKKGGGGGGGGCFLARYEKRGGGGEVLSVFGPIRKAGGPGCCRFLARYDKRGGGGKGGVGVVVLSASGLIRKVGRYDRVSGDPGYSTVVEFMRRRVSRMCRRGGGGGAENFARAKFLATTPTYIIHTSRVTLVTLI